MKSKTDMPKILCKAEENYSTVSAIWEAGNSGVNQVYEMLM